MLNQGQCVITLFPQTFSEIDGYEILEETENLMKNLSVKCCKLLENFELCAAHRLRPRPDKKPRSLEKRKDRKVIRY